MAEKKVAVVAVGGNALVKSKQHMSVQDQYQAVKETSRHIADMIEDGWDIQLAMATARRLVSFCAVRNCSQSRRFARSALDVCGADSQGAIGYAFQQNLQNELKRRGINKPVQPL